MHLTVNESQLIVLIQTWLQSTHQWASHATAQARVWVWQEENIGAQQQAQKRNGT
jgi:hypothetical protein